MFFSSRRFALSAGGTIALAGLLGLSLSAPAQADDHPAIFTFSATRTSGPVVAYSGRYAVWSDDDQAYEAPSDPAVYVSIEQYFPEAATTPDGPWDEALGLSLADDGSFSGTMKVYPSTRWRAAALLNPTGQAIASTDEVTLPYYGRMPVVLSLTHAAQVTHGKPAVKISGFAFPECGLGADGSLITCGLHQTVHLQSKIKNKWKDVGLYKNADPLRGYFGAITIKHPKGKVYRFFLPGNSAYLRAYSTTFTPSANRGGAE